MNWYRGFYRLWLAFSVVWIGWQVAHGHRQYAEWKITNPTMVHDPRSNPSSVEYDPRNLRVVESWAPKPEEAWEPGSADRICYAIFCVPAVFYAILRVPAWILRGFRRQAEEDEENRATFRRHSTPTSPQGESSAPGSIWRRLPEFHRAVPR
jgi:hypothetical protein